MKVINLVKLKKEYLVPREKNSHKGDFGHVMIVGGDYGMAGAVRMAGEAALRIGAGLTSIISHPEHAGIINAIRPELLTPICPRPHRLTEITKKATVLAIGPGMGRNDWSKTIYNASLKLTLPKVIDADALWFLAKQPIKSQHWILTPHPKEAARLLNAKVEDIQSNRKQAAIELQNKYGGVIVLKGAGTLICTNTNSINICHAGNPGMATGGMGDVLTGMIAGLVAQKLPLYAAAALGVVLHATAGDCLAAKQGERGMLASDLFTEVRNLMR